MVNLAHSASAAQHSLVQIDQGNGEDRSFLTNLFSNSSTWLIGKADVHGGWKWTIED